MRRIVTMFAGAMFAVIAVAGSAVAGGGGHGGACDGFGDASEVALRDFCLDATAHFATPGVIGVVNEGAAPHQYRAVDGSFDTGVLASGEAAEITVARPGVYRVFCPLHASPEGAGMAGVLVVGDGFEEIAAPSSAATVPPGAALGIAGVLVVLLASVLGGRALRSSAA